MYGVVTMGILFCPLSGIGKFYTQARNIQFSIQNQSIVFSLSAVTCMAVHFSEGAVSEIQLCVYTYTYTYTSDVLEHKWLGAS